MPRKPRSLSVVQPIPPELQREQFVPPPLTSTVRHLVAVRIDGVTYLVPEAAAERFRVEYARRQREASHYAT